MEYNLAKKEDAEKIVEIHFQSVQSISPDFYSTEIKNAWSPLPCPDRIERIARTIDDPAFICTVAFHPSQGIVGFTIFSIPKCFLQAIYVSPELKGQGIGSALLLKVESDASSRDVETIELKSSLNAESFYTRAGYSKACRSTQELANGTLMQAITMRKHIGKNA